MAKPLIIFHLQLMKSEIHPSDPDYKTFELEDDHHFYKSLTALHLDKGALIKVSLSTLQKHDFTQDDFSNDRCIISRAVVLDSKALRADPSKKI